jgi:AcrR family transcriptional regulator
VTGLREAKKRRTRSDILAAAQGLFTERGYAGTTTAEIARRAGIAEGTVFNYFTSKAEILVELVQAVFRAQVGLADQSRERGDLTERVMAMLDHHLSAAQHVTKAWLREVYALAFSGAAEGRLVLDGLLDLDRLIGGEVRGDLDHLREAGVIGADVDLDAFMEIAYSVVMVGFGAYVLTEDLAYADFLARLRARLGLLVDAILLAPS